MVLVSENLNLWGAVTDAIDQLSRPQNWLQFGRLTPDEVAAYFFDVAWRERAMTIIGVILPYATTDCPSFALPCDGSTYNRVDFPNLYAVLDAAYIVDADTFLVPDLRDRVPMGEGSVHPIAEQGGADTHTLVTSEIPSHTHVDTGHTHTEITAIPAVAQLPVVPVPTAVPAVGVTGVGFAAIGNTGGDGAHNNLQPYSVIRFCIVAQ